MATVVQALTLDRGKITRTHIRGLAQTVTSFVHLCRGARANTVKRCMFEFNKNAALCALMFLLFL